MAGYTQLQALKHVITQTHYDTTGGGGISSVVACRLVVLWVTGSIPMVGESFQRRLEDLPINRE